MNGSAAMAVPENGRAHAAAEVTSFALGLVFTAALFFGVAHFEGPAADDAEPDLATLRVLSVPPETPPPRPVETLPVVAAPQPVTGLDLAASASATRIAVVPPDLSQLVPPGPAAPAAKIEPARLYSEFKPNTAIDADFSRIYQVDQVDQRPLAVSRTKPNIPPVVRGTAESLRVFVTVLIDARGAVSTVRVLESSGNKYFDQIIVRDIKESWVFSPAAKAGKKVRCMITQNVRVNWAAASRFESR
jgi:TonB family protein